MRGNGAYNGRYYYDWPKSDSKSVEPPQMQASMDRGALKLIWDRQSNAREYEITWNSNTQKCGTFVQLYKGSKTDYVIPRQFVDGKMQFKIRAINKCGVASPYSRTLILTITKSGGGGAPAKDCSG